MSKKNILSCIQPTGQMHLGNYLGAVSNYVKLQDEYNCKYGVVDYHNMTVPYNAKKLRENTWNMVFQLLAVGVKPENLFIQSLIPEHVELSWIFSCVCSYGELSRMTQFKDKGEHIKSSNKDVFVSAGLFTYPVLQAADILIYHADYVPVGKDQDQHLELSRHIAARFNSQFKTDYFKHPETLHTETPKILSTADPLKKMSKSLGAKHHISVFSEEAVITKQLKSAVTDIGEKGNVMSPGVENLFTLLKAFGTKESYDQLMTDYNNDSLRYSDLKGTLTGATLDFLRPIQEKYKEIQADKRTYKKMIKESSEEIRKVAITTVKEVRDITGLQSR